MPTLTAFIGHHLLERGPIVDVVRAAKERADRDPDQRLAVFDDAGRALDLDLRGTIDDVLARLPAHPLLGPDVTPARKRGPGRPRLGVTGREVSLLPRHWDWLAAQRGGASAAIRRLVDEARRRDQEPARSRAAAEAAHRFMWDMAGDLPDFEEASRALWANDHEALREHTSEWPADIRDHLERILAV